MILTIDTVLGADNLLEGVVRFGTNFHSLSEAGGTSGEKHELLEGELVTSMGSTVNNVESGSRESEGSLNTGEVSNVLVGRDTLLSSTSIEDGDGNTKNGVGAKLAFVGSTIEFDEEVINILLGSNLEAGFDKFGSDGFVYVGNGLEDT